MKTCLTYFHFTISKNGEYNSIEAFERRRRKHEVLAYVPSNCGNYACEKPL